MIGKTTSLAGNSGIVRSLDPESAIDVDLAGGNWICPEQGGANSFEVRMAVKEISSSSTCSGIIALF